MFFLTLSHCNIDNNFLLAFLAVWLSVELYTLHYSQDFCNLVMQWELWIAFLALKNLSPIESIVLVL